jgi:gamma-glutamylcyclotransferase (GGCT)/AIG2-like uncharacterized protein YtfP
MKFKDYKSERLLSEAELIYKHPDYEWYYVVEKQKCCDCWKIIEIDNGEYKGAEYVECPTVHCSTYESCINHLKELAKLRKYKKYSRYKQG